MSDNLALGDMGELFVELLDLKEPVCVDLCILEHNIFLDEDIGEGDDIDWSRDEIDLGTKRGVNKADLRKMLARIHELNNIARRKDRSYWFEGHRLSRRDGKLCLKILWGS